MEPNQQPAAAPTPTPAATSSSKPGFGLGSISFLVAVLLFLLPFVNIKCGNMTIKEVKGFELATGFTIENGKSNQSIFGDFGTNQSTSNKNEKKDPNVFAMAALGLGILSFILSLGTSRGRSGIAAFLGIAGVAAMVALWMDINKQIKLEMPGDSKSSGDFNLNMDDVKITAEFTPWFYVTVVLFLVAAYICWQQSKKKTA